MKALARDIVVNTIAIFWGLILFSMVQFFLYDKNVINFITFRVDAGSCYNVSNESI
jgi:hypothetical protein